jgi:uncharacterized protein (DUF1684 family)
MTDSVALQVEQHRKEKDAWFKESHDSPIPWPLRKAFRGLAYWPYDPAYRFEGKLHRYDEPETLVMQTSKDVPREMRRVGYFEFVLNGTTHRLQAYESADNPHSLFLPFRDGTSGKESYGAGRYLDLHASADDVYVLDFNVAYNPWCAYSDDYVCPFPPRENWLEATVRAGEKEFPLKDDLMKLGGYGLKS